MENLIVEKIDNSSNLKTMEMQQNNQQAIQQLKLMVGEKSYYMSENATDEDKALFEIVIGLMLLQKRQALRKKPKMEDFQNYFFEFNANNKFGYSYVEKSWFINEIKNPTFSSIAKFTQQFKLSDYKDQLRIYKNLLLNE